MNDRGASKKPFPHTTGFKAAHCDLARIERWWHRHPQSNIGIPTGIHFDAIDIDGDAGLAALYDNGDDFGRWPVAATGGGGWHWLYLPSGAGNGVGILDELTEGPSHVDFRGKGGYVVAPPSVHPSGEIYQWVTPPTGVLESLPRWLELLVCPPAPAPVEWVPPPRSLRQPKNPDWLGDVVNDWYRRMAMAVPSTRNDTLNAAAYRFGWLEEDGLDTAIAGRLLYDAARRSGLPHREIEYTINRSTEEGRRDRRLTPRPRLSMVQP